MTFHNVIQFDALHCRTSLYNATRLIDHLQNPPECHEVGGRIGRAEPAQSPTRSASAVARSLKIGAAIKRSNVLRPIFPRSSLPNTFFMFSPFLELSDQPDPNTLIL